MNPKALINKADKILNKYGASDRKVYKRVITRTGGDQLLGRAGTVAYSETEMNPQPTYQRGGRTTLTGNRVAADYVMVAGRALTADMALFNMSPSSISTVELENPNIVIVMKDAVGNTEVFQIEDFNPLTMGNGPNSMGVVVLYEVFARSVKR